MKIVPVDGFKIRNTLDDDFGVIHSRDFSIDSYMPKFYIPEGEYWVDHRFKDEAEFLKDVDEYFATDWSIPYAEMKLRVIEKFCNKSPIPEFVQKVEQSDGLTIKYVDGAIVRKWLDPEFIFGGHDLVYPTYIPKGEIWLDIKTDPAELPYVLIHEAVERENMLAGRPYHIAHEYATVADKEAKRKDGIAWYPGDPDYPWRDLGDEHIIKNFYVVQN